MRFRVPLAATLAALIAVSCSLLPEPTPTPLPGWYRDARELLVPESAFPGEWRVHLYKEANVHPRANHVHRELGRGNRPGIAVQDVWRSYTTGSAKAHYDELRQGEFHPSEPLPAYAVFIEFEPPTEISVESRVADEFFLACGWWTVAVCKVVARYRNYVVLMRLPHEAEVDGHHTDGLTYGEIETVVRAMDARFEQFLDSLTTPVPSW